MIKIRYPWGPFLKKIALIAVPVALQNLLTTTGSMVDTMMIASLGQTEVGAVGLCAQFSSLMFSCYSPYHVKRSLTDGRLQTGKHIEGFFPCLTSVLFFPRPITRV